MGSGNRTMNSATERKVNIVFLGTSGVCIPFLELLRLHFNIPLIITQPDAMGGRNRKQVLVPPVKTFALEHDINVFQPEKLKSDLVFEKITCAEPEIGVVISYGKLIPQRVFEIPKHRMINVHFSMLPKYRGAAPVQRAIENGDSMSGISIFEIEKRMDAGDIWVQQEMEIFPGDTTDTLWERMSEDGAPLLIETIDAIIEGKIEKTPQDDSLATFAHPVQKEEGRADFNLTAQQLFNKFRAFDPWPSLTCCSEDKAFKLTQVRVSSLTHNQNPGDILCMDRQGVRICCGEGTVLEVMEFQPQGKTPMNPFVYCLGNKLPKSFCSL